MKAGTPKFGATVLAATLVSIWLSAGAATAAPLEIRWTKYGVPQVTARNHEDLGYGYGYAMAQDRICGLAEHVIGLRGERSRWYGADGQTMAGFLRTNNISSDLFFRVQLSDELVKTALGDLKPETRDLVRGFVAGINHYVEKLPSAERKVLCAGKPIPTFVEADIARVMMSIGNTGKARYLVPSAELSGSAWSNGKAAARMTPRDADPVALAEYAKRKTGMGSNAWVYGGDVVAGKGAMLMGNPHSGWNDHWLSMHQVRLTIPGKLDAAGVAFLGLPFPLVGFNKDVAWSILQAATITWHVQQIMKVDEAGPQPSYVRDGVRRPLEIRPLTIPVLEADGRVSERRFNMAYSELGPIYKLPALPGRPEGWYAITDVGDGNARGLDQFLAIARTASVGEFKASVEANRGLGAHLVAGDRHGDIAYVEAGPALDLTDAQIERCLYGGGKLPEAFSTMLHPIVLDGSRSECAVRRADGLPRIASAERYPSAITRGIIHNTNNSYKYSVYGQEMADYGILFGNPRIPEYNPRVIMSARRMRDVSSDGIVTPDEALDVFFDNRNFAAEEWLDDILAVCADALVEDARTGCAVLKAWDRKNNAESRGAILFHQLWNGKLSRLKGLLPATNPVDPFPRQTLAISAEMRAPILEAIASVVGELRDLGFQPGQEWGSAFFAKTGGGNVPLHGGSIQQGLLNVEQVLPLTKDGFPGVEFGTAYLQRVRWEKGEVVADVLLAHGQNPVADSESRTEQLKMFSEKRLYSYPFGKKDLGKEKFTKVVRLKR
ncbi:penicillin acylase family protein [Sphingosinicella sp.]|uniref:penicillin acylase family protein n=1 Tax=Sphingosinicella sp. TaxID=1917971 RepID=UPI0035B49BE3